VNELRIIPVAGIPEVRPGDHLGALLADHADVQEGDVLVVTQKVVSKAEGRLVHCDDADPAAKQALVESQSVRVLRRRAGLVISETSHGFVCANAGVDFSNVPFGQAALLPVDADRSARRIRYAVLARTGCSVGVIVSDTFGRAWRRGLTDVAIGCAGVAAVVDLRGQTDALGRPLRVTEVAVADELAGAAELVMGKSAGIAAAVIRGVDSSWFRPASVAQELIRRPQGDLFR
jgi:coenzyme F420-0:L-glutamate ligase/coenzyme F420-1:gamma-L-glutamate ligase